MNRNLWQSTRPSENRRPQKSPRGFFFLASMGLLSMALGCNGEDDTEGTDGMERQQTIYGSGFDLMSCDQITEEDIYRLCLRIHDRDPEEFEAILLTNKFHQHIGPNNIYGTKMALYAMRWLDAKPHTVTVMSEVGRTPPVSCLNDGIMVGACASFGRGMIYDVAADRPKLAATFLHEGELVRLEVKPEYLQTTQDFIAESLQIHGGLTDEYFKDVRAMGLLVWEDFAQTDLFNSTTLPADLPFCAHNDHNLRRFETRLYDAVLTGSPENIEAFLALDPCVENGVVTMGDPITVSADWTVNNETIEYTF